MEEGVEVGLLFEFGEAGYLRCSAILRNKANEYIAGCGDVTVNLYLL